MARTTQCTWGLEGLQVLVVAPSLLLEPEFVMQLAGGHTWASLLQGCKVTIGGCSYPATFIAGQLRLWTHGEPKLVGAGFVVGEVTNLAAAIQGLRKRLT